MKSEMRLNVLVAVGALLMSMLTAYAVSDGAPETLATPESFAAISDTAVRSAALLAEVGKVLGLTFEPGAKPKSEIPGAQLVGTSAGAHVNFHGNSVARIEHSEEFRSVAYDAGLDPFQRIFIHQKCSFHRVVMPPIPHRPPCRVVGAGWEIECHDGVTLLKPTAVDKSSTLGPMQTGTRLPAPR
jgi:hypothetical protein